jgi:hypothetical protein
MQKIKVTVYFNWMLPFLSYSFMHGTKYQLLLDMILKILLQ